MHSSRVTRIFILTFIIFTTLGPGINAWAQANPVPFLNQPLTPASVAPGGGDFNLTVSGTGFGLDSRVNWNGRPLSTTFVSSSQLTALVPAANITKPTTGWITVSSPGPGGGTSNVIYFQVTKPTKSLQFSVSDYPLGYKVGGMAVGDFNGDGRPDVAVTRYGARGWIDVLLSNRDGTFTARRTRTTLVCPTALLAADFNGDGKLDLAVRTVGNCASPNFVIEIMLGQGDGTFAVRDGRMESGDTFVGMVAADFNGDGNLDLGIVEQSRYDAAWISMWLGNGDGTFQYTRTDVTHPLPSSIAVGDFNGDGKLDAVITNLDASWRIRIVADMLIGQGDGTFVESPMFGTVQSSNLVGAVLFDFNGDGKLDLAFSRETEGTEDIFIGHGDGTFENRGTFRTTGSPSAPVLGDFNGDGKLDLLMSDGGGTLYALLGKGAGRFQQEVSTPGSQMQMIAAGDFNGDGALDLIAVGDAGLSIMKQVR